MTIQELYIFACKNDLYDKDVYEVINQYNKINASATTSSSVNIDTFSSNLINKNINIDMCGLEHLFDKPEWSTADVLELFSI